MNCSKIERLLSLYIDKELPAQNAGALQKHLAGCQRCTSKLIELTRLKGLVQDAPKYTANPFLWTRIATALSKEPAMPVWVLVPKVLKLWVPAACTLIIASSLILTQMGKKEEPSVQDAILEIPASPENMERIALNLLVYNI